MPFRELLVKVWAKKGHKVPEVVYAKLRSEADSRA